MKHNYYEPTNDLIFVFSLNGRPLMPTTNQERVARLLKEKRAKIVNENPLVIQLLYRTSGYPKSPPRKFDWVYNNIDRCRLVKNPESAYRWYRPRKKFY